MRPFECVLCVMRVLLLPCTGIAVGGGDNVGNGTGCFLHGVDCRAVTGRSRPCGVSYSLIA